MSKFLKQQGQAALESLFSALLLIVISVSGSGVLYIAFAKLWLNHVLYEAVVCYAEGENKNQCEGKGRGSTNSTLIFGKLNSLTLTKNPVGWEGDLNWQLKPGLILHLQRRVPKKILQKTAKLASHLSKP